MQNKKEAKVERKKEEASKKEGKTVSKHLAAAPQNGDKIVGGYECARHQIPWQVSLNYGYHFCGGSLINDQWVISAAHCWYNPSAMQVILGEHDLYIFEGTEQLVRLETIIWHPDYDYQTMDNDIMMLKLAHPVKFNNYIQPVSLPKACPAPGTMCTVSGWGNIYSDSVFMPYRLQCVEVPIMSDEECDWSYPGMITSTQVCAGYMEGGKDACQGDSGGPLACDGVLHGIVSWGYGCAERYYPGVYTKVCSLLPWIESTLAYN
ncbi:trypsin-like [Protopterus annectens]|uniref:trypsin-like n=1 Tax=Protopterus annectens TaxID=7888 RepID=UPI001CF9EF4E|nr:trypsin-like [Protopterus annectens]